MLWRIRCPTDLSSGLHCGGPGQLHQILDTWLELAGTPRGRQHLTAAPTETSPQKIWHPLLPQPDTFNFGISNRQSPSASNVLQALWLLGITKEIEKFQEAVIIRIVNTVGLTLMAVRLQKHSSSTCPWSIQIGGVISLRAPPPGRGGAAVGGVREWRGVWRVLR